MDTIELNGKKYISIDDESENIIAVGNKVFLQTVTHAYTGMVKSLNDGFILLGDACWIADTGRFHNWLIDGIQQTSEIEPFTGDISVNMDSVVCATLWNHELPDSQK